MSKHFAVFGNHPALSLAELVSVLSDIKLVAVQGRVAVLESNLWDGERLIKLLGGTVKLGDIIMETKAENLKSKDIADLLASGVATASKSRTLDFGLTFFGDDKRRTKMDKLPMLIKKDLKRSDLSVRWVTSDEGKEISPAAVVKCKLLQMPNADLIAIEERSKKKKESDEKNYTKKNKKDDGGIIYVGRTTHAQNADAWSERDYGRPRRDDHGGMLPPKLARMMVNLAKTPKNGVLLDPFCGSGTVLMEAILATDATRIIGSDIAERCIRDTQMNDDWLAESKLVAMDDLRRLEVFRCDARLIDKKISARTVDAVATEGWLGPPLRGNESEEHLRGIAQEVADIWRKTLIALKPILKINSRVVMVVPSYKAGNKVITAPVIEELTRLGYEMAHPLSKFYKRPPALFYQRQYQHLRRNIYIIKLRSID